MARIGKQPINIPDGVTVNLEGNIVKVTGPKGELQIPLASLIKVELNSSQLVVKPTVDSRVSRQLHGVSRTLIANMVLGVTLGWSKTLEINGTGFKASITGQDLVLNLGFSHQITVKPREGINFEVKENKILISGFDKALVGETAAKIKSLRPPDPYKAKGIKYLGEYIRRKAGKAAKTAGATTGK